MIVETRGDLLADAPLSQIDGKAFFTREIETALLEGRIDLAVHSLKDLATTIPDGIALAAILVRDDPRDALVAAASAGPLSGIESLPHGARVGTSSLRRRAMLLRQRPDLTVADLRGNVPTRVEKLDRGDYDAVVLAAAGLHRLGLEKRISAYLPIESFLPAPGQGAIAVQTRSGDNDLLRWRSALDDPSTRSATTAERSLLARLEGGCQIPLGALATCSAARVRLAAVVTSLNGRQAIEGKMEGATVEAKEIGERLADDLLSRGADELLKAIRTR